MANLVYRESQNPNQPLSTLNGSYVKGGLLSNAEGDWNFWALNNELSQKVNSNNPSFTGDLGIEGAINFSDDNTIVIERSIQSTTVPTDGYRLLSLTPTEANNQIFMSLKVSMAVNNEHTMKEFDLYINIGQSLSQITIKGFLKNSVATSNGIEAVVELWHNLQNDQIYIFAIPAGFSVTAQYTSWSLKVQSRKPIGSDLSVPTSYIDRNVTGLTPIVVDPFEVDMTKNFYRVGTKPLVTSDESPASTEFVHELVDIPSARIGERATDGPTALSTAKNGQGDITTITFTMDSTAGDVSFTYNGDGTLSKVVTTHNGKQRTDSFGYADKTINQVTTTIT